MRSYINYVKRQNKHVQDMHAYTIAFVLTSIIAVVYLQLNYHIFTPEYKRLEANNNELRDEEFKKMFGMYATNTSILPSGMENMPPWASNTKSVIEYNPWQIFESILENSKKFITNEGVEYKR